ncbi:MAG: PEP-CTERM sorting domain-containing protein [Nitrosospira sp.]|nr:PEP-CTERM sorting domain-containing protein [Nitrosospira sp.]
MIATAAFIGILTAGGAHAAEKKADYRPNHTAVHPSAKASVHPSAKASVHSSAHARVNAPEKKWTPPPGRLPDSIMTSLVWDTDPKQQIPMRFNQVAEVPEPGSIALIGIGLLGLIALQKRKK